MRRRAILAAIPALAYAARAAGQGAPRLSADPQAPMLDDRVGEGYARIVIARWGDGVLPNAPPFDPSRYTIAQASSQFPYDAVLAAIVPPPPAQDGIPRLLAVFANPDAPARMLFEGADQPAIAGRLQGATVLNLQFLGGRWVTVDGGYQSRRITDGTLCQLSGPASAAIGATAQGLLAPQAGCRTAWGTSLMAEGDPAPWLTRLAGLGLGYGDPAMAPRFGWVVELDPQDPLSIPIKRTALGRFARAGIAAAAAPDGRPVIFMSEDRGSGFFFRFIAQSNATDGTALDAGTLAVAQIDGREIVWRELGSSSPALVGALDAAQAAGGSAFDRPAGLAIAADRSKLYLACQGNRRAAGETDALNPRAGEDDGHILAFTPPNGDLTAARFPGELVIAAGNPATTPTARYAQGSNCWLRRPRTLDLDPMGQLWIGTDQGGVVSATADGLFIMQTGGASQYLLSLAYLAPVGAAIGGAAFDADSRTTFAVVRHPGATPGASFAEPATRWPTLSPGMPPQTTVIGLVSEV